MSLKMTSPTALRTRMDSYALGVYKVFMEVVVVNFKKELIRLEMERTSALFINRKSSEGSSPPSTPIIFRKTSNQNFEKNLFLQHS